MPYALLADGLVLIHLGFVAFVVAGGFLTWRWPWIRWGHVPAMVWGVAVEVADLTCPLTPLEQWLRRQAGEPGAATDFVGRLLLPVLYPEELTRTMQICLAVFVIAVNAVAYARLWRLRSA